jgi:hypothetical protein
MSFNRGWRNPLALAENVVEFDWMRNHPEEYMKLRRSQNIAGSIVMGVIVTVMIGAVVTVMILSHQKK